MSINQTISRRVAIRNIALASTATLFFTGCTDKNVLEFLVDDQLNLNQKHKEYLSKISETLLPLNGISDKIGSPVDFILTMVNDCSSPEDLRKYVIGFEQYKQLMLDQNLKINNADPEQVIEQITQVLQKDGPQDEMIHFINTTKDLSIWNLKTSEFYKTEKEAYKMIPDPYEACITI